MELVRMYPDPNPFITDWLTGPRCRSILYESAEIYKALYQEEVAKRTGRLARSARVWTEMDGDRWTATLSAGDPVRNVVYGASHEFGTVNGLHPSDGAHDMNKILDIMANAIYLWR